MTHIPGNTIRVLTAEQWAALTAPYRVVRKPEKRSKKAKQQLAGQQTNP